MYMNCVTICIAQRYLSIITTVHCFQDELFSESSIIEEEAVTSSAPAGMTGGQRPKSVPVQLSRRPDVSKGLSAFINNMYNYGLTEVGVHHKLSGQGNDLTHAWQFAMTSC